MDNNNNNQQPIKVPTIPWTAKITIEIGGGLYARLSQLMIKMGSEKPLEEYQKVLEYLREPNNKPRDEYEYHLVTLLALLYEIELKAKEQNQIVEEDLANLKAPPQG